MSVFVWQLVVVLCLALGVLLLAAARKPNITPTTRKGAEAALTHISEWSKWMSGIQTATIASLALLVVDEEKARFHSLPEYAAFFALGGFCFLGIALFFNAWVMSSMPSQVIRIHARSGSGNLSDFDIYEQPLYGWSRVPRLGFVLNAKHWFWATGLLWVALFFITLMYCGTKCN